VIQEVKKVFGYVLAVFFYVVFFLLDIKLDCCNILLKNNF